MEKELPKICVSLGRTRHQMVMLDHKALAEKGAELVEIRLDWLAKQPDLTRLLKDRPTPTIITCRRKTDRGRWKGPEDVRQALLRSAIVAGVEYVDLEMDIAGSIRRYGKTKRIVSFHNFDETPENLAEIHQKMAKLDPDIIKIVTMANSSADVVNMLMLVKQATVPTVGFCMGELGVPSRVLCGKYGSPFSYATFSKERELAPGQLAFSEMRNLYHFEKINAETKIYGVLGDPIAHSLSPLLHNKAFQKEKLNCVYLPFRVIKGTLPATLEAFDRLPIEGYSVTIPHKEAVLQRPAQRDQAVMDIGAANTLYKNSAGKWSAANTDYSAALESIQEGLKSAGREPSIDGLKVLMMGAGGAARAIGLALARENAALMVTNRTAERGRALATELGCQYIEWKNRASAFADILVNCTPVGMHPNLNDTPFEENWLREGQLVFDTIYNPENTLLIKRARDRGCITVSGVEMFVRQAAAQFHLFTGKPAPLDFMREVLRRGISAAKK